MTKEELEALRLVLELAEANIIAEWDVPVENARQQAACDLIRRVFEELSR